MAKLLKGNLENVDLNSPMFRYLCAQSQSQSSMDALKQRCRHLSPLSPLENLMERSQPSIVYRTLVRGVQREEVLVMDGVSVAGGGRSSRSAYDMSSSSSSSDSSGKILYKTDLC
ncbi:PREDICTED: mRNA decay activator ZFP36, partial [Prunus dulcis]